MTLDPTATTRNHTPTTHQKRAQNRDDHQTTAPASKINHRTHLGITIQWAEKPNVYTAIWQIDEIGQIGQGSSC
jgi:hypothetical protein